MSVPPQPAGGAPDPSMEDILASIRRILSEDEAAPAAPAPAAASAPASAPPGAAADTGDVLALDPSMMVEEGPAVSPTASPPPSTPAFHEPAPVPPRRAVEHVEPVRPPGPAADFAGGGFDADLDFNPPPIAPLPPLPAPLEPRPAMGQALPTAPRRAAESEGLIAPEAAAAAASSMGSLLRKLAAERSTPVNRGGGVTIEDIVRDEMRPMLKEWLDTHLPGIVERLVRAEIERVVTGSLN